MKKTLFVVILGVLSTSIFSQHEHHMMADTTTKKKDTVPMNKDMGNMKMTTMDHSMHMMHSMPSHAYSRNLPMSRNGSGTGWNPDASPMYMWMKSSGNTDWMFHGNIFLRYTNQDIFKSGIRGAGKIDAPNWFMTMMNKKIGEKGLLNVTAMVSFDRITEGGNGYPLLFQSGETWKGQRLVDRQHPHDLFSGLSIGYTHSFTKDVDVTLYVGYPGEPALSATTFMHRISSMNDPDAPLGHHWQDATHITFGVATLGVRYKNFKLEGSTFTGREPGENRYNFDKPKFDSYSYRLSFNPTENWALQFSHGFIKTPEVLEPGVDVTRTTASVLYAKKLNMDNHVSAAGIWGLNDKKLDHKENSFLLEGNYQFMKNAIYSRYEYIQKSEEELDLDTRLYRGLFNIHALTAGYNRNLASFNNIDLNAGTQFTVYGVDKDLQRLYGKTPIGFEIYLQLRPALHKH